MSEHSTIEWTDATWNPITGCSVYSPGCKNCYAMKLAGSRLRNIASRVGLTHNTPAGPVWNGQVRFNSEWLDQPQRWKRPRQVFVCAHGDLFHESVPDAWIDEVFAVMSEAPWHTFQVLTKRSRRMRDYMLTPGRAETIEQAAVALATTGCLSATDLGPPPWPFPHVHMGVSIERQLEADERVVDILATPAHVRYLSVEPMLGAIDLTSIDLDGHSEILPLLGTTGCEDGDGNPAPDWPRIDWVIAGGESGQGARPSHPAWFRSLRDQCAAASVPFFFKQWGEWCTSEDLPDQTGDSLYTPDGSRRCVKALAIDETGATSSDASDLRGNNVTTVYRVGKRAAGRLLDGIEHNELPSPTHDNERTPL